MEDKYEDEYFNYFDSLISNNIFNSGITIYKGINDCKKLLHSKDNIKYYYLFYYFLSYFYYIENEIYNSKGYLEKSILLENNFIYSHILKSYIYISENNIEEFYKEYEYVIYLYNKNMFPLNRKDNINYEVNILKAKYFTYKKKYSKALKFYFDSEDYNNKVNVKYILYRNIASLYYKLKDFGKSIEYYDIAINKLGIIAYYDKAILYYNIKRYDEALKNMNIYCQRNSNNLSSIDYYHRAVYNGLNDNFESAYNDFLKGLDVTPDSTKHLFDMLEILYREKRSFKNKFYDLIKIMLDKDFYIENDNITTVYKYRPIDINTEKLILNSKVRLSDYNYFNDPADPLIKLNKRSLKNIYKFIKNIKISSLSPTYDNFLMWSHYSNEHKGICIEYDISNFKKLNPNIERLIFKKVGYIPEISFGNYKHILESRDLDLTNSRFISLFYLKHKNWQYENEYRFIADTKEEYIHLPIKSIYFGMNASNEDIELIINLVKDDNIKYYKMNSDKNNLFNLIPKEINIIKGDKWKIKK
ncbi:DUF2971 domain-containing protein [Brachyspira hyodysenteriae]|uniref:DUF2971 domain-containing protein n=1 Tax=Brachyspira hyodysenteriae TaxID=159 RepID=UPI00063DD73E|nr:DUF2971 domain-containing protein [Brachyspira hyodysenteriae]KLI43819.1 hypothetical protein SZ52_03270 [Brachyspira hyodysenteriae]KLI57962.1 hypothetical protein SZ45_02480 [Brachyspira hyodysenteriae]